MATWGGPSLTPIAWPLGLFELTLGTKVSCTLMYAFDLDLQPFGTGPDLQLSRRPQSHPCPPPLPTPRLGAPLTHGVPCEDGFRRGPRLSGARGPQGRDPELILTAVPQVHRRPLPLCGEAGRVSPAPAGPGGGDPWPAAASAEQTEPAGQRVRRGSVQVGAAPLRVSGPGTPAWLSQPRAGRPWHTPRPPTFGQGAETQTECEPRVWPDVGAGPTAPPPTAPRDAH